MLKHVVLCKFKDVTETELKTMLESLSKLKNKVPGFIAMSGGVPLAQDELTKGFNFIFIIDFEDQAALQEYLHHPDHKKIELFIMDHLENGMQGIVAFDYKL